MAKKPTSKDSTAEPAFKIDTIADRPLYKDIPFLIIVVAIVVIASVIFEVKL